VAESHDDLLSLDAADSSIDLRWRECSARYLNFLRESLANA
jgi:hypothetical protein